MASDDGSSSKSVVGAGPQDDGVAAAPAEEHISTLHVFTKNFPLICKLGAGFFADAYDMFVIDIVLAILTEMQEEDPTGLGMDSSTKGLVASATSIGAVAGMLFFGVVGDQVGRRIGILCTGAFVALGAVASACIQRSTTFSLAHQLFVCRLVLGFGIGGEYPLSAAMASERSDNATRGRITAGVFSMQGLGMIFAAVLPLILLYAGCPMEITWRVLVCFTVVPSLTALYLRLGMKESDTFKEQQAHKKKNTTSFSSRVRAFLRTLQVYIKPLIGTTMSWLCMDITFYGTGEFKHSVSAELFPNGSGEKAVEQDAWFALVVSLLALPGYICACWFIDSLGRWKIQVLGFSMMIIFYVVMAICTQFNANKYLNLIIFGITFFWTNFGPNTTSYVIPSEIYPTSVKTTCHGMSAASGKVGAIIGSFIFPTLQSSIGLAGVMYVCTGVAAVGLIMTLIFLPKKLVEAAAKGITLTASSSPTTPEDEQDSSKINSTSSSASTVSVDGEGEVHDIEEGRVHSESTNGFGGGEAAKIRSVVVVFNGNAYILSLLDDEVVVLRIFYLLFVAVLTSTTTLVKVQAHRLPAPLLLCYDLDWGSGDLHDGSQAPSSLSNIARPPPYTARGAPVPLRSQSVLDLPGLTTLSPTAFPVTGRCQVVLQGPAREVHSDKSKKRAQPVSLTVGDSVEVAGATYIIEKPLGSGSFGTVWAARSGEERFAIKVTDDSGVREAEAMQAWKGCSPAIRISRLVAFDKRRRLLVLGLVADSVPLDEWLRSKVMMPVVRDLRGVVGVCRRMLLQMAEALDLTAKTVVHRDVCSHNILVNENTGDFTLIDFGLCAQKRTFNARQGMAGDCRYWPACEWLLFLRGHRYVEGCPAMLQDYLQRLDHHALALTVVEVFSKLYRRLEEGPSESPVTEEDGLWQSSDFSTALSSVSDYQLGSSSVAVSARSSRCASPEQSEIVGLDSPVRSEMSACGDDSTVEVVEAFESYWREVTPFWKDLLGTFKGEGNWEALQRRLDNQMAPSRVHEALVRMKDSILEVINAPDVGSEVRSLFSAVMGLLLCASPPLCRQISFREAIHILEGTVVASPVVVEHAIAPVGLPVPLVGHVPSHMRLWTVDNPVSLARNLTPIRMFPGHHQDTSPVGITPPFSRRPFFGTALPQRLTFNGSS
ncbi:hypothetical protein FOL47_007696 [Perkinsus chesapeaki]|uniref:Uncharacterized protein n=1 Tax=Perkinsus chesapeaki TaxID=330153 RepID=A0A7J6LIR2_PERCH|nr:hypothetical protein FOL47_007696 [Perkinsus chesapeaki]